MQRKLKVADLRRLSPDNSFIAISKNVGAIFLGHPDFQKGYCREELIYINLRSVIVATVAECRVRNSSALILDPPEAQPNGDWLLARFWLDGRVKNNEMNEEVSFRCRLVAGSPHGNLPFTIILDKADFENRPWHPVIVHREGRRQL